MQLEGNFGYIFCNHDVMNPAIIAARIITITFLFDTPEEPLLDMRFAPSFASSPGLHRQLP
jgi:hypothetical protein